MNDPLNNAALFDAHAHYSFAPDPKHFAAWAAKHFAGAFSTTVDLEDFTSARQLFASFPTIRVGLGAHPWWVARGEIDTMQVARIASRAAGERFIGEVGLDFGNNGLRESAFATDEETKAAQVEALCAILDACASSDVEAAGKRIFSFHAVRSADTILDLMEEYDLLSDNTTIFHWFSGSNAQLQRARELGCCFSVNTFMLQTKRGREYAKAIPADRLLVETDLPEEPDLAHEDSFSATCGAYEQALVSAYGQLADLRGEAILPAIAQNVSRIFGSRPRERGSQAVAS